MSRRDLGRNPYGEPKEEETLGDKAAAVVIYGLDKVAEYFSNDQDEELSYLEDGLKTESQHRQDLETVAEQTLSRDD